MNKKLLKAFKKQLKEEEKRVLGLLKDFTKKDKSLKDDFDTIFPRVGDDLEENAVEVSMYDAALPLEFRLEKNLQDIRKALERIKTKKYGICEKCGKSIPIERLKAFPEAKMCLKCVKKE